MKGRANVRMFCCVGETQTNYKYMLVALGEKEKLSDETKRNKNSKRSALTLLPTCQLLFVKKGGNILADIDLLHSLF